MVPAPRSSRYVRTVSQSSLLPTRWLGLVVVGWCPEPPTFTEPVSRAGGFVTSLTIVTFRCYDGAGNRLGTSVLPAPNWVGAETGVDPNFRLEVTAPGIARCTFEDSGNTYTVDDFFFTTAAVPPPWIPVVIDNVSSGPPARAPGVISLDDQFVILDIFNVEAYLPRRASPRDVRIGETWEDGTPAEGFVILDINGDGNNDIRLWFSISRLVAEDNLSAETTELTFWGRDRRTGLLYRGTTDVTVLPPDGPPPTLATLTGRVINETTRAPVAGALVHLVGTGWAPPPAATAGSPSPTFLPARTT